MISPSRGVSLIQKGLDVTRNGERQLTALLSYRAWRPRVRAVVESSGGFSPPEAPRSVREPLGSYGSRVLDLLGVAGQTSLVPRWSFRRDRLNLRRAQRNVVVTGGWMISLRTLRLAQL